jgi:hypothetical protein
MEEVRLKSVNQQFYKSIANAHEVFFLNVGLYKNKHPNGEARGFHCICIEVDGEKRYMGFGLPEKGLTENQLGQYFVNESNKPPLPNTELYSDNFRTSLRGRFDDCATSASSKFSNLKLSLTQYNDGKTEYPGVIGIQPFLRRLDAEKIKALLKR